MGTTTVLQRGSVTVFDYRCTLGPHDAPFVELHHGFSLSYVRKGSFGCRSRGRSFELVAGSMLIGHPGDEYMCTHDRNECAARRYFNSLPGQAAVRQADTCLLVGRRRHRSRPSSSTSLRCNQTLSEPARPLPWSGHRAASATRAVTTKGDIR